MEIRSLKYLISLYKERNFTKAAQDNFVTQPAISIALKKLQEEFQVKLFIVDGKNVQFTQEGMAAVEYASRIVQLTEELNGAISDLRGLDKGAVKLGTIDAASMYVLPVVFSRFTTRYPGLDIHLEIASTEVLLDSLIERRLDAIIATLPIEDNAIEVFPVFEEKLVLIVPPGHSLCSYKRVKPRNLADYPFISFHQGSITRRLIEQALRSVGINARIAMSIDSPEVIKKLVSSGLGIAILPERIVSNEVKRGELATMKIEGVSMERRLGLVIEKGRYLSLHLKAFLTIMSGELGVKLPERLLI